METAATPLDLRGEVIAANRRYRRSEISLDELYLVVDRYIEACAAHMRAKRQRFRKPSRAYVLRALT